MKNLKLISFTEKNNWKIKNNELYKKFILKDFKSAVVFFNTIAELSDSSFHHPKITNSYNIMEVFLTTHDSKSITEKDIRLAQKIDASFKKLLEK